jgi:hypothetical protein
MERNFWLYWIIGVLGIYWIVGYIRHLWLVWRLRRVWKQRDERVLRNFRDKRS